MLQEEAVQFSCDTDNQTLLRVTEQGLLLQELAQGSSIIVDEASGTGKYLCMSGNTIFSIHYVTTGELMVQLNIQLHCSNDHKLNLRADTYILAACTYTLNYVDVILIVKYTIILV